VVTGHFHPASDYFPTSQHVLVDRKSIRFFLPSLHSDFSTMAKLYFYYSAMNAGKSTMLLQSSYNYQERGMESMILVPDLDRRFGEGVVGSRIGLQAKAHVFNRQDDLRAMVQRQVAIRPVDCVLVDEAQFLTRAQVNQLSDLCDFEAIPVLAYGLRTDFQGELFEGSRHLLAWADAMMASRSRLAATTDTSLSAAVTSRKAKPTEPVATSSPSCLSEPFSPAPTASFPR
jgi:thymidine kinase